MKNDLDITNNEIEDFVQFYTDNFTPIEGTYDLVRDLITKYKVGLLTNVYKDMYEVALQKGHIPDLSYHAVIKSCDYDTAKPEKRIYQIAHELAQVEPSEILFVDDTLANIEMAQKLGWHGVHFQEDSPSESVEKIKIYLSENVPPEDK